MPFITLKNRFLGVFIIGLIFLPTDHVKAVVVQEMTTVYSTEIYDSDINPFTTNSNFAIFIPTGTTFDRIQFAVPEGFATFIPRLVISGQTTLLANLGYPEQTASTQIRPVTYNRISSTTVEWTFGSFTMPADRTHLLFSLARDGSEFRFYANYLDNNQTIKTAPVNGSGNTSSPIINGGVGYRLCNGSCDGNLNPFTLTDPPLLINPAQNSFITITRPTPYGVTLPVGPIDTRAYFFFDVAQATTTKTVIEIYDAVTNQLQHTANVIIPTGNTVNFEMPVNFTMATGSKKMIASYRIASNNQDLLVPDESFFNVGTNTYLLATGLETPESIPAGLTQIECATFDVGCQFQKAMVFVFVPSQSVLNKFSTLWQELKYLKPFGYVTIIYDQIKAISVAGVGAYTMPVIPFISTIFDPLKTVMGIMLWGVFAFVFYNKRLKNLDI